MALAVAPMLLSTLTFVYLLLISIFNVELKIPIIGTRNFKLIGQILCDFILFGNYNKYLYTYYQQKLYEVS